MTTSTSVVIIGAGIAGVSLAYELSTRADLDVTVVEQADAVATGVTSLGSGGFRAQFGEREEIVLSHRTLDLWDRLQLDEGVDLELHHNGYLALGSTPAAAAKIERDAALQAELGVDVRLLDRAAAAALLPGVLLDDVEVAAVTPRDGYGRPPVIAALLRGLAEKRGASFVFGRRVNAVLTSSSGAVSGVVVGDETVAADVVVNAAGLDSPSIAALVGATLPVAPWRQHQYESAPLSGSSADAFPCFLDPANDLYFKPMGRATLVGYADAAEASRRDYQPNPAVGAEARRQLAKRWPEAAAAPFAREWVGCYEVTPDRRALVGEYSSVPGLHYSTGFSGHGLMNSLATAEALADVIVGRSPAHIDLSVFSADRFDVEGAPTVAGGRSDTFW